MSLDFINTEDRFYESFDTLKEQAPGDDYKENNQGQNRPNDLFDEFYEINYSELIHEMLRKGFNKDSRVLSIGIGPGNRDTGLLLQNCPNVLGLDVSLRALRVCQKKYPQVNLISASGHALPFKENTFDFICFVAVVHHMTGQSLSGKKKKLIHYALDEAHRILRQGGHIICLEPNMLYPSTLAIYPINSIMQRIKPGWRGLVPTERNIAPQKLRWLLQSYGFCEIQYHATTFANSKLPEKVFLWVRKIEARLQYNSILKNFGVWTIYTGRKV